MPAGVANSLIADRYRLEKKIGEGGMGEVYAARHVYIEKRVAVKLVRGELVSDELATRFQQEARAASLIGHPNIVGVDDFGRLPDGSVYIAMELLQGESLHAVLKRGERLPLERVVEIMRQICRGLEAAHRKGIVHRDMKPENVFLDRRGEREQVKILDFGIAKFTAGPKATVQPSLTQDGSVFGTPSYMSPEQAMAKPLDTRSDLYSCGVIMYQLLTGSVPFSADSFVAVLMKHVKERVEPPSQRAPERDIPPAVEEVVLRALAKDPDARQQTAAELEAELERAMLDPAATSRRGRRRARASSPGLVFRLVLVGALSAALGVILLQLMRPARRHTAAAQQGSGALALPTAVPERAAGPPVPVAAAPLHVVRVDSAPSGAEILLDGRRVDQTPANLTVAPGPPIKIVLRKAGWRDASLNIDPEGPAKIVISLHALPAAGAPPGAQPAGAQPAAPAPPSPRLRAAPGRPVDLRKDVLLDPYR